MFAYRTAVHKSTGVSPFSLMFGRQPKPVPDLSPPKIYDPESYQVHLHFKLAELHTHMSQAAKQQKQYYDEHSKLPSFAVGDLFWLWVPTSSKFQCKWEGEWRVKAIKSPITVEIIKDKKSKVVHVNRIWHQIHRSQQEMLDQHLQSIGNHLIKNTLEHIVKLLLLSFTPLSLHFLPPQPILSQCVNILSIFTNLQIDLHMELEDAF